MQVNICILWADVKKVVSFIDIHHCGPHLGNHPY